MKRVLFFAAALSCTLANAQDAPNKNEALVAKATATWCGPCGSWGWDLMEDIIADNSSKCMVMSVYADQFSDLYNTTAEDLGAWAQSFPNWGVNNKNRTAFDSQGLIYDVTTRNNVKAVVDSFAMTSPLASTGFYYNVSGSTITVTTNTKFWQSTSGEYYLAAYLIEDSVINNQNTTTSGMVSKAHHNVLRGSMSASTWGDLVASGTINANTEYPMTFTATAGSTWNMDNVKVVVVLWQKNGGSYDFINANHTKQSSLSVSSVAAVNGLQVYPNPSSSEINVTGTLSSKAPATVTLVNALGQTVYSSSVTPAAGGSFSHTINLGGISNGLYQVRIASGNAVSSEKILVSK